jgi:CHAT domain-containing protein
VKKIQVISTEPFIPWELVHLKDPDAPLGSQACFLAQMGLVRWLHQAGWPPSLIRIRQGRARHIIPNYPDHRYALPAVEEERTFLVKEFRSREISPRPIPVRTALQDPQGFDLCHFACHGAADPDDIADAKLMLEGRIEGAHYIPEYLNALTVEYNARLRNLDGNRPLVFLNACQAGRAGYRLTGLGGFAQAFLSAGAGLFAGTLWSVGDQPASAFAKSFYKLLKKGAELSEATIKAREEARKAGDASWLCYVVYGHPSAVVSLR